jgi:very-short-patch-repair endonuclease
LFSKKASPGPEPFEPRQATPVSYDVATAKKRIGRVFRYLEEMHRVRTPPIVRLEDREWCLPLDSLPRSSYVQTDYSFGRPGDPPAEDNPRGGYVLRVGRPRESECPEPSVVIKNWMRPGWDRVDADPETIVKKTFKGQAFADSAERVDAFDEWLERKHQWESTERAVVDALNVFSDLFDLRSRFDRESEKYQLFLADGVLVVDRDGETIHHPVLIQRVELLFNPVVPEFCIVDSEDNPEVYVPLLRHAALDGTTIQHVTDTMAREHFHPLAGESTSRFLKDLVQRSWTDGEFIEDRGQIENVTGPYIFRQPHLFLGSRNLGLGENIERYLEALPRFEELPESLLRIVGIESGREGGQNAGEHRAPVDLLLTKPANMEQEQVIKRVEETGAVLVQGPPGTGKSHTIANLIGHFLAQDKSILVTSHASKALRVVRDQLAKPLQPLCVSVLTSDDESNKQLEESITGIINYLASTREKRLVNEIEQLTEQRTALKAQRDELRGQLVAAVKGEYKDFELDGERVAPSDAARRVAEAAGRHDWLAGPLPEGAELPLSKAEVEELYALNTELTSDVETLLGGQLPMLESFPTPKEFAALFDDLSTLEKTRIEAGDRIWLHEWQDADALEEFLQQMRNAASALQRDEEWAFDCLEAGRKGGEHKEAWLELARMIDEYSEEIAEREPLILEHGPEVRSYTAPDLSAITCRAIIKRLESGKRLGRLSKMMKPEWKELIEFSRVQSGQPKTLTHFRAILHHLETKMFRDALMQRWDRQMAGLGAPSARELGRRPERKIKKYADEIRRAVAWYEETWAACERRISELGLDWARLARAKANTGNVTHELERTRDLVLNDLEPLIESRRRYLEWKSLTERRQQWIASLDEFSRQDRIFPVVRELRAGLTRGNYDKYAEAWQQLEELIALRPSFERRQELLERLAEVAPNWAEKIRERKDPHHDGRIPGDLDKAWRFRQWERLLAQQTESDLDKLQEKLDAVEESLLQASGRYVEKRAWLAQLRRTGLDQQQALTGWLGLHKKIGKGGGKHVPRLKEEAKNKLVECRSAVPVWIMPLSRVTECFDLATTRFDVVILDEASQSDVLGLVAFAIGREVVVVGDHEQVSPYAVGQSTDRVRALIDEILIDIPNKQLYDGKTSVYDLARQSFGGTIRLLEHFRCVPDIIQFSNHLCYNGEIRPLREASSSHVFPHLVAHKVKNGKESNGVNKNEALEIASLISAVCRLKEYDNCTIGVICMLGTDQAVYIDSLLRKRLTVTEYQQRRILCGNASQFQGDERDIIFLSIVNSPSPDGPLFLRQRDDARKVFNVAASRARDQLWVVHSLSPGRDLKGGDLRLRLISHAEDPSALRPEIDRDRKKFRSDLEKAVFLGLSDAGYRIIQQYMVGECVIDLVVEDDKGDRVAIQCDGDRAQTMESVEEEMEREQMLRRLGWNFIRVRGSELFQNPERALKKLQRRLHELEIPPVGPVDPEEEKKKEAAEAKGREEPLHKRVIKRAEMIRRRWKDVPAPPVGTKDAAAAEDDEEADD